MTKEQTNIKVVVRVRPYNRKELEQNQRCIIKVMDNTTLLFDPDEEDDQFFFQGVKQNYRDMTKRVNKKLSMEFDRVFDIDIENQQIFQECTSPLVDSVLNGYNCSVFVYGATGAGKTFTMLGNKSCPGLTFLTMRDLFQKIQAQSIIRKFDVGVSYLEVYNEQVMNLLTKTGPLKLREDSNGVVVSGLILKPIYSAEELLELLALGNSNRTQHPTDANAESSRSHAVFQVHIRITELKTGSKRTVKLSMIDLAGSERAASTKGIGVRFKEGASINKSLLALGNCINKLADGLKHIPYRDSNLTRILKDSLGGNCQTLMVANVSMSSLTYEDTYNTLKYASRAKKIRTTLKQNALKSNMPKDFYIKKVSELMAENDKLKENHKNMESMLENAKKSVKLYDESELSCWHSRIDIVYSSILTAQKHAIDIKSKMMVLNLHLKHLNEAQEKRKLFVLNQNVLQEDLSYFSTSVNNLEKQIDKQEEELPRWMKKYQEANKELEKLKKEIADSKLSDMLKLYIKEKDLILRNVNSTIKLNHQTEINKVVNKNVVHLEKDFFLACGLLQQTYEKMNSDNNFMTTLYRKFEQLERRFRPKEVLSETEQLEMEQNGLDAGSINTTTGILVNGKRVETIEDDGEGHGLECGHLSTRDVSSSRSFTLMGVDNIATKRKRCLQLHFDHRDLGLECIEEMVDGDYNISESDDGKLAKKARNLNETQILSAENSIEESNTTFNLCGSSDCSGKPLASRKKELINNVLSDQISRLPNNANQLKNLLLRSKNFTHQGLLKTVAAGVQKENKKYSPNKVVKSARQAPIRAGGGTGSTVSIQSKSARQQSDVNRSQPIVRTNRAASFRAKK